MKAFFVLLFKEIKKNIGSFLTVALTVFLAVAIASGMLCYAVSFKKDAENYFDSGKMWDIKITSTLGFTREDVLAVGSAEGVEKASAVIGLDTNCAINGVGNYGTKICGIDIDTVAANPDNTVAAPRLISGSYPGNANSCVAVVSNALNTNIRVGDVITLNNNVGESTQTEFTVTGLVFSPEYSSYLKDGNTVNHNGTQVVLFVSSGAFAPEALYTEINVLLNGSAQLKSFSREYAVFVNTALGEVNVVANKREEIRGSDLGNEYQSNIDKLQKQYDYIKSEGESEVKQLTAIVKEVKKRAEETDKTLSSREKALAAKKAALAALAGTAEYRQKAEEYNTELAQFNSDKESNEMNKATAKRLEDDIEAIKKATEKKLTTALKNLEDAKNSAPTDYVQKWHLATRESNISFASVSQNAAKISAGLTIVAIILFIAEVCVVLLAVYSTTNKRRKEIGIMKATGSADKSIKKRFLSVFITAGVLGAVIGIFSASSIILPKISAVIGTLYNITVEASPIYISVVAAFLLLAVIITASIICCNRVLALPHAELIYANRNSHAIRLPVLSSKIPVVLRILLRNFLKYKYIFAAAAICIALVSTLVASALNIAVKPKQIYKNQYNGIQKYNISVDLRPYTDFAENEAMKNFLTGKQHLAVMKTAFTVTLQDSTEYITAIVPITADTLDEFIALKKGVFNKKINLSNEGIVITEDFADRHGISRGDTIEVAKGEKVLTLKVADVCKNYIGNCIYMHPEKYTELTKEQPVADTLLINAPNLTSVSESKVALYDTGIVYSVSFNENNGVKQSEALGSSILLPSLIIGAVLLYYIMSALGSAREKEIKMLKFSDYSVLKPIAYLSLETVTIWLVGTVLGVGITYLVGIPWALMDLNGVNTAPNISVAALIVTFIITLTVTALINTVVTVLRYIKK